MERCPSPPEITSRGCRALSRQRTARDAAMTRIGGPYSRRWPHLAREGRIVSKHRIAAVLIGSDPFFDSRRDQLVAGDTGDRGSSGYAAAARRIPRGPERYWDRRPRSKPQYCLPRRQRRRPLAANAPAPHLRGLFFNFDWAYCSRAPSRRRRRSRSP
jgi:hypothetical protein